MKCVIKNALLLVLFFGSFNVAQAQMPSMGKQTVAMLEVSPAGSKIIDFVKLINSGEAITDTAMESLISAKLIEKHGKDGIREAVFQDIRNNDGKLTLYVVNRAERAKFEVYAKGSKEAGSWLKMEFMIEPEQPYKIAGVGVEVVDDGPKDADKPMKIGQ